MNNLRTVLVAAAVGLMAISAKRAAGSDLFTGNELSGDVYGFAATHDKSGHGDAAAGPGVGLNYFFTPNLGLGVDSYADAFDLPYLLNASGIFRYPIGESRIALSGFAGFGRQWNHAPQWTGHIGGGAEYRFDRRTSFFVDVRGVFPENTKDYALFRFGLRMKFW
jgi:hypothetical protein